ncbi:hypothetical protein F5883DRAFT_556746 [Diaporthe sp. PMI_573]|nr:hypothetical protein F5883DRAFT_556746 [Diaporthaceae sp. PMI_573]
MIGTVIHLWYSAFITRAILTRLQSVVKPLITECVRKISSLSAGTLVGNTWTFSTASSVQVVS